jgi:hypothetical protein
MNVRISNRPRPPTRSRLQGSVGSARHDGSNLVDVLAVKPGQLHRAIDPQRYHARTGPGDDQVISRCRRLGCQAEARANVEHRHDGAAQVDGPFDDRRRAGQRRDGHGAHQLAHSACRQPLALSSDLKDQDLAYLAVHGAILSEMGFRPAWT